MVVLQHELVMVLRADTIKIEVPIQIHADQYHLKTVIQPDDLLQIIITQEEQVRQATTKPERPQGLLTTLQAVHQEEVLVSLEKPIPDLLTQK